MLEMNSSNQLPHPPDTHTRIPWGIFLFLLAIIVYATPITISLSRTANPWGVFTARDVAEALGGKNIQRQIALLLLGVFSLFSFYERGWAVRNRFRINGVLGWLILFYVAWAVLSITWTGDLLFTGKRVGILVLFSLGALATAELLSFRETIALTLFICSATLIAGIITSVGTGAFNPFYGGYRFAGNMHPIMQGWNAGLLTFASLSLSKSVPHRRRVFLTVTFIAFVFLFLTRSRMAFLAFLMGAWFLVESKPLKVAVLLGIVIVGCFMILSMSGESLATFGEKTSTLGRDIQGEKGMDTMEGRIELWNVCLGYLTSAEQWLYGYGYNSFFIPVNIVPVSEIIGWAPSSPHSGYVDALMGLGYIGAGLFVSILVLSLIKAIVLWRRSSEYAFMVAVFVWLMANLYTEADIITRPYFTSFLCMTLMARLGFLPEEKG